MVSMARASVRTVSVLARPGTPSMRTWPSASSPMRSRRTIVFCPTMTRPTSAWRRSTNALSSRIFCWIASMSRLLVSLMGEAPLPWSGKGVDA